MKAYGYGLPMILLFCVIVISCGGDKQKTDNIATDEQTTISYLPEKIDGTDIERSSKAQLFAGESLYEYIDGGAEQYHEYGFVEVATAYYKSGESEVIVDIYRFDNPDDAYGLYSVLRPDGATVAPLAVEGYASRSSLDYVKGSYMVRLTGYDDSDETGKMLAALGEDLDERLPGKTDKPVMFALFPADNRVAASDKIIANGFMSTEFLKNVYTVSYDLKGDTVRLFLVVDKAGALFDTWVDSLGMRDPKSSNLIERMAEGVVLFRLRSQQHGKAAVASTGNWLAGAINIDDAQEKFYKDWLLTLPH